MKKFFLSLVALVVATVSYAQNSGLGFNYQAVVRKTNGLLLANQDVTLRISLFPGQNAIAPTWIEVHNVRTDASGCFGITVGHGTRQSESVASTYADINFAAVYYWMKIEIQENNAYREVSFSQLPSTPYSEVAHNALTFSAGMIVPFAGLVENIPEGWLLCDGSAVSRSTYSNLYRSIGVCWGEGNGSSTFNLPDLRGMFLRGVSGSSSNDQDATKRVAKNGGNKGNNVGSYQEDAIRNITGKFTTLAAVNASSSEYTPTGVFGKTDKSYQGSMLYDNGVGLGVLFDASRVVSVGSDNRPKNVYVNYIIKY